MSQGTAAVNSDLVTDFYEGVLNAKSPGDLRTLLEEVVASCGFQTFSVIYIPRADEINFSPYIVATNWPKNLIDESNRHKRQEKNQIVASLRSRHTPLTFDLDAMQMDSSNIGPLSKAKQEMICLFRDYRRVRGTYFPCIDSRGQKGAVSISGERELPSTKETSILHLICHFAFSHLHFLKNNRVRKAGLTKREEECLNWAARGKTIYESSIILGVSENTVISYLTSTSRKLSARNKAHMIALAYKNGLLNRHGQVHRD